MGGKEKAAKYYQDKKDVVKKKSKYKNLTEKEKQAKKLIKLSYKNELLLVQQRENIEKCMG